MADADGRIYYVITLRGDRGPLDRTELAEQLAAGEVQADDRVRNAFGRQLGVVSDFVAIRPVRRTQGHRPQPSSREPAAQPRKPLLIGGLAAGGALVAGLLWSSLGSPTRAEPAPLPEPEAAQAPQAVAPAIAQPQAQTDILSATWTVSDIGGAAAAPTAEARPGGRWWIAGAGIDIWGECDQFRLVATTLSGDGTVTARVQACDGRHGQAKSGVMLRTSTDPSAAFVLLDLAPGGVGELLVRQASGRAVDYHPSKHSGLPLWLRLQRHGTTITPLMSADGVIWTAAGKVLDVPALGGRLLAGVAVCSHEKTAMTTTFSDVAVSSAP